MKTMKDYHDLYLKCDNLLLADVFEKFRNNSLKNKGLCPDPGMYIFFEKVTRGGVSYISNGYSKAKNKYLKSYYPKQESEHITYLDANNLYAYAMSKIYSTGGFEWIAPKKSDLNKYTSNSSKVYLLEVDLEHPKDYPLAPDKK